MMGFEVNRVHIGDCRDILASWPENCVDAVVCDPPYHLTTGKKGGTGEASVNLDSPYGRARVTTGFMGMKWDGGDVAFKTETWAEVLRVMRPGAHLLAAGAPRTHHRMVVAIEDAGLEIRDCIFHIFGSGFPKSMNVSKALSSMPSCSCEVTEVLGESRCVDSVPPAEFIGARIGTEPAPMPSTGITTEKTCGIGAESGAGTERRSRQVKGAVEKMIGKADPVMLGALDVTRVTKSDQITLNICGLKKNPESLRDQMMGDQPIFSPAVSAEAITTNNALRNNRPALPLISPLSTAPSGVVLSGETGSVRDSHTEAAAISSGCSVDESACAETTPTDSTDPGSHEKHYTTERQDLRRCEKCGGLIGDLPDGLGTALKPAAEIWVLARKPLSESTVAANVLKWGTGALNIEKSRIPSGEDHAEKCASVVGLDSNRNDNCYGEWTGEREDSWSPNGRWPANVLFDRYAAGILDGKSPEASRFFYVAKPDRDERNGGLEREEKRALNWSSGTKNPGSFQSENTEREVENFHPTVKPVDLMSYLIQLVTPPGGVVLDPFLGSGTTAIAAVRLAHPWVGCEMNPDYAKIAQARIAAESDQGRLL